MELTDPVRKVLHQKGTDVWSLSPRASVYEAIEIMSEKHAGALLVIEEGRLAGIISERDYARKVILLGRSSKQTAVAEIMTSPVVCVYPHTTVQECLQTMTDNQIRHLPVLDGEKATGVVSIGDLVRWVISAHEETIRELHSFIAGRYPG